jgi:GDP-mannose transporter
VAGAGVFVGVTVYTAGDINFTVLGYMWIAIWYTFAVFEMVYVKKVVDTVQMTTWSRTYYQVTPCTHSFKCQLARRC